MLAGAASGALTRALLQPLDVLKIRFQLQVEVLRPKYTSLPHAVITIWREEGPRAFWKGHVPAQWLSIVYGGAQFASFEAFTSVCHPLLSKTAKTDGNDVIWRPSLHFFGGAAAGVVATLMSYPLDVVRTRLVAQKEVHYKGFVDAVIKMHSREGLKAFFKGIVPTLVTIGPYAGMQYAFYTLFKQLASVVNRSEKEDGTYSVTKSATCGALAGLCAKTGVFPLDTIKKRLQIQGFAEGRLELGRTVPYRGMLNCIVQIVKQEGLKGFYKGLSPGLIKAVAYTSTHFVLYELCIVAMSDFRGR